MMTDALSHIETIFGPGEQVEVVDEGPAVTLRWSKEHQASGLEMARYKRDEQLLSIFPKFASSNGFKEQFSQVRELQIDTRYLDWDPESPVGENERTGGRLELTGLPEGFGRLFAFGLGVRRDYRGIVRMIEAKTGCTVVRFGGPGYEGDQGGVFRISLARFARYVGEVELHKKRGYVVVTRITDAVSHNQVADITGEAKVKPKLGRLGQIQAMIRAISDDTPLDSEEQAALVIRMDAESKQIATEQPQSFGKLREGLELVTLEVLIDRFEVNLTKKGISSNEPAWQKFFKDNTFALKQIFAAPLAFYGEQLQMRISNANAAGGQIADFVLANTLTRSMVVVEIKTPATTLMMKNPYRGQAGGEVYAPHKDFSGAVAQLQAQMGSARTDFDRIVGQDPGADHIDTRIIRGAVIAGRLDSLDTLQKSSFMRYRDGLHGIEVITFDEVLGRLHALRKMLRDTQE